MAHTSLNITLVQTDIHWEDKQANLQKYEQMITGIAGKKEVVVLPEMFATGFTMNTATMAETIEGPTVQWMKHMSKQHRCILTGSAIIEEGGKYYNRMLWVQPDGNIGTYDKRHLFAYGDEDQHFTSGNKRLICSVKGFRICLMVCYDLRFPVWARNANDDYDVLIYVANWPERRSLAWKTLLQARAIENMSYVVGVNRVGTDAKDLEYSGDSSAFGPLGEVLWQHSDTEAVHTITLDKEHLTSTRRHLPFLNDADKFIIVD